MTKKEDQGPEAAGDPAEETGAGGRGRVLLAGVLGSIVGAVTALLLTPWRGAEARRKMKDAASAAGASAKEKGAAARAKAADVVRRAGERRSEREGTSASKE